MERARTAVEALVGKKRPRDSKDLPFSRDAKKVFETALLVRGPLGAGPVAVGAAQL